VAEIVVVGADELRSLFADLVAEVRKSRSGANERPVTVNQAAKHFGMDDQRLRDWCEYGCDVCGARLPHIKTSDQRGLKTYLTRTRDWMERHRTAGGCLG